MALSLIELQMVRDLVRSRSGIVLDVGKEYLIEARLGALAKSLKFPSISTMLAKLHHTQGKAIERDLVDAMTTNETSFFRDASPFEAIRKSILPDLMIQRAAERRLSIWCAASSTGQEPYSLLMTMLEAFPQLAQWKITFIASDLSREVLRRAKAGRYSQLEVSRGLPEAMLHKYFVNIGTEWEINQSLRDVIDFREINLFETWPIMPQLDLVFIRNVMIYFNHEAKKKILGRIRSIMSPCGYLFLGGAETTLNVDDNFDRVPAENGGCYRLKKTNISAAAA